VNLPVLTSALVEVKGNPLGDDERVVGSERVVRGGKSCYVTDEDAAKITGHFPAARVETIAAAGHNPHMETRAEFCAAVGAFLSDS
jgi:esterase